MELKQETIKELRGLVESIKGVLNEDAVSQDVVVLKEQTAKIIEETDLLLTAIMNFFDRHDKAGNDTSQIEILENNIDNAIKQSKDIEQLIKNLTKVIK